MNASSTVMDRFDYKRRPALDSNCRSNLIATMEWKDEVAYAMTPLKILTVPIGGWPLQEYNKFALARHILSTGGLVSFSILCQKHHIKISPLFSI